ncbi:MAG: SHOCT domain-containing protein [Pseudomonadota bacterium]
MSNLTAAGRATISDIARRYGLSDAAVEHMARAVANGGGTMAQFNIPELGGGGQWMAGGMTMVGDMFNHGLQNTVANLCGELSNAMASTLFFEPVQMPASQNAWPAELGMPSATGGQNQARYAYFPQARRLAFDHGDGRPLVLLDTGEHQIGGFSQQQSGPGDPFMGVSVSSQFGQFALSSFPLAEMSGTPDPAPVAQPVFVEQAPAPIDAPAAERPCTTDDILGTIERLAKLRDAGALSEDEFSTKKAELLSRL